MSVDTLQIILGFIGASIVPMVMAFFKMHHTTMAEYRKLQSEQNDAMILMASSISEVRGEVSAVVNAYQSTIIDMQAMSKQMIAIQIIVEGIKDSVSDMHRRIDNLK